MPEYIPWSDIYSVEVPSIDEQHKKLIALINRLHHHFVERPDDNSVIEAALVELESYAQEHFSYEEKLLKEHGYPEYMKHKFEHRNFFRRVEAFRQSDELELQELLFFLQSWLTSHIKGVDKRYSDFLVSAGAQ
ncbi:MAG TPA: bacteriohemerythrin [Sediminispirochaeta sp.]|nr:bacteriohemerythrin [Sediminispirochaeta sp.]